MQSLFLIPQPYRDSIRVLASQALISLRQSRAILSSNWFEIISGELRPAHRVIQIDFLNMYVQSTFGNVTALYFNRITVLVVGTDGPTANFRRYPLTEMVEIDPQQLLPRSKSTVSTSAIAKMDWAALKEQKLSLVALASVLADIHAVKSAVERVGGCTDSLPLPATRLLAIDPKHIEGIVNLLDAIQDEAAEENGEIAIFGRPVEPDEPMFLFRFRPQRWEGDTAVDQPAEGNTDWYLPQCCLEDYFRVQGEAAVKKAIETQFELRDALRFERGAARWINEWDGPFEVELVEVVKPDNAGNGASQ